MSCLSSALNVSKDIVTVATGVGFHQKSQRCSCSGEKYVQGNCFRQISFPLCHKLVVLPARRPMWTRCRVIRQVINVSLCVGFLYIAVRSSFPEFVVVMGYQAV